MEKDIFVQMKLKNNEITLNKPGENPGILSFRKVFLKNMCKYVPVKNMCKNGCAKKTIHRNQLCRKNDRVFVIIALYWFM